MDGHKVIPVPDPQIDDALARATGVLPHHEDRPSQRAMAQAVAQTCGDAAAAVDEYGSE